MPEDNLQLVQQYFRAKRDQLLAMSKLAVAEHQGLRGSHREELQRIYLREILPRRFSIGRGMVYGVNGGSNEADIVIWDGNNYPSLPLTDSTLFFAESVRVVLESKSDYDIREFRDVLNKCRSISSIVPVRMLSIEDYIALIRRELDALAEGQERPAGMMILRPYIGTAAVFIDRGQNSMKDLSRFSDEDFDDADLSWPDLTLLLKPGRIALKRYPEGEANGLIEVFDYDEDSLFVFTNHLLQLLADRSVAVEDTFYMDQYMRLGDRAAISSRPFPLLRDRPVRRAVQLGKLHP
jgi:hypothetical protein